jgi:hypothetical protein
MNTEALIKIRNKRMDEIYNKKKEILELEKNIKDINKQLWNVCDHKWKRISWEEADFIKRRCERCNLLQHYTLYS